MWPFVTNKLQYSHLKKSTIEITINLNHNQITVLAIRWSLSVSDDNNKSVHITKRTNIHTNYPSWNKTQKKRTDRDWPPKTLANNHFKNRIDFRNFFPRYFSFAAQSKANKNPNWERERAKNKKIWASII